MGLIVLWFLGHNFSTQNPSKSSKATSSLLMGNLSLLVKSNQWKIG